MKKYLIPNHYNFVIGWQGCLWVHLLWLWDERELCLLQGGICGQYDMQKLYAVIMTSKNLVSLI